MSYSINLDSSKRRFCSAVFVGCCAGALAALLDLSQAAMQIEGASSVALLALQAFGKTTFFGLCLSLFSAGIQTLAMVTAKRLGKKEETTLLFFFTTAASPFLIYVAVRFFQGGKMSKLPAVLLLIGITAVVMAILFALAVRAAIRLLNATDSKKLSLSRRLLLLFAILSMALAARYIDAVYYKRLYIYLHCVLAAVTVGGIALSIRVALGSWNPCARSARIPVIIAAITTAVFACSLAFGNARQTVRSVALKSTVTLADIMHMFPSRAYQNGQTPAPSRGTFTERNDRHKKMQLASSGDWPVFPQSHILLITVDALRADKLGAYGHKERDLTPNIDRFASEKAIVFEKMYTPAPHSSFSISSFMTSRFTRDESLLGKEIKHPTIADILNDYGYVTAASYTQGIFFTEGDAVGHYRETEFGFKKAFHGGISPKETTETAIQIIDKTFENGEPPMVLWTHYFNVHEPYESTRFGSSISDRYDGEVSKADAEVGRLIDYASRTLTKNLIIFVTADHGEELEDHGGYYHGSSLYEEQVRVPFLVSVPGVKPNRIAAPISLTALAPTALRLVGIEPPGSMIGQDLRPAIFGGNDKHVAEPVIAGVMRQHMVLSWPWKLIVDPEKNVFELYNLKSDPFERINRYDRQRDVANKLHDELNAWMDDFSKDDNNAESVLNLGLMRDPRAVSALMDMAYDTKTPTKKRIQAIDLLGEMRFENAKPMLVELLNDEELEVAQASALTLGEIGEMRGIELMHDALLNADSNIRNRAALILAKNKDTAALPALLEALQREDASIRENIIRALGDLRDREAVEPLLQNLPDEHTRYLIVLALGKIGDERAYEPLMHILDNDRFIDVRGYAVVALGWLGLKQAIPRLIRVLKEEPEIKWTSEALIRLNAVGKFPLFGTDVAEGLFKAGFLQCTEQPQIMPGEFLGRTWCRTIGNSAELSFFADAKDGAEIIIRARNGQQNSDVQAKLNISIDGLYIGQIPMTGKFQEHRIPYEGKLGSSQIHKVTLKMEGFGKYFDLDHFLVLAASP